MNILIIYYLNIIKAFHGSFIAVFFPSVHQCPFFPIYFIISRNAIKKLCSLLGCHGFKVRKHKKLYQVAFSQVHLFSNLFIMTFLLIAYLLLLHVIFIKDYLYKKCEMYI